MARTAAAVVVGNEILSGKVSDENGPYLARALRSRGVDLKRVAVVPDEVEPIAEEVRAFRARFELVVTSGGLGTTHDDVTVRAVAAALDLPVVRDPMLEERVRARFGPRLTPEALRLADAVRGAAFLEVPGLWLPVPAVGGVVLLPGVPELFRRQLDAIADRFREAPFHLSTVLVREPETVIAAALDRIAATFPDVALGSYPRLDRDAEWRVRLTLESRDAARVDEALRALCAALPPGAIVRVE